MSTDSGDVKTRDMDETPDITLIDSNLNVTGHLTAKRMRFGTDRCNICIETVRDGGVTYPEMYITLPNNYYGVVKTQRYRMRSVIEAIQEINRRTASLGCNVRFDTAKDMFDTSPESNDMFACDTDGDGLPAARISVSVE